MSGELGYMDSSAITKLVVDEAESAALRAFLASGPVVATSALALVEVVRAVRAQGPAAVALARAVLSTIEIVELTDSIASDAATLDPPLLRSLDAIHLATARALGDQLGPVITYDRRMQEAIIALGLTLAAPA